MGIICGSTNQRKRFAYIRYQTTQEEVFKAEQTLKDQYLKVLEQRYYAFQPKAGLNQEQLRQFFPNIAPKLLNRLFQFLKLDNQDYIDFAGICLLINKFYIQGKQDQLDIIFHLYDLDKNDLLDKVELKLLVEEIQNSQLKLSNRRYTKDQFKEWAMSNLNFSQIIFKQIFLRPDEEKLIIEQNKYDQGDSIYIISSKWWQNWKYYVNLEASNLGLSNVNQNSLQVIVEISPLQWQARPGPIDNRDIAGEYEGELKPKLIKGRDYEAVGKEAWENFIRWYGIKDKQLEFKRKCEKIGDDLKIQLYPTIVQGLQTNDEGKVLFKRCFKLKMYETSTLHDIRKKLFKKFEIETTDGSDYLLYVMKINEDWCLIQDLDSEPNIPTGTFFVMTKLQKTPQSQINTWKLGQKSIIIDPSTNTEKMCIVQRFSENFQSVFLHIEGSSFFDDFQLEIKEHLNSQLNSSAMGRSSKIQEVGLQNLGNTCYMNAVLQCLLNTSYLMQFLINEKYKHYITKSNSLTKALSNLAQQLHNKKKKESSISPQAFQDTLIQYLPKFKKYEAQDADEFLIDLLTHVSKELNENESVQHQIIDPLFQIEQITEKRCQNCSQTIEETIYQKTFRLIIKEQSDVFKLRLQFFINLNFTNDIKQQQLRNKDLVKKSIILRSETPKMKDLYIKIQDCLQLSKDEYELAFIYQKEEIKTITCYSDNQLLTDLGINNKKSISLFQLGTLQNAQTEFQNISNMFNHRFQEFKVNDFIDFQYKNFEWKQGKIVNVSSNNYTLKYRSNQQDQLEFCSINDLSKIVQFRRQVSVLESHFEKVVVLNYCFNNFKKQFQKILKPIILFLPFKLLTLQELKVYVYKQIQRFINFNEFRVQSPFQSSQVSQEVILNFFANQQFPYYIRVLDQDRKCLFCQKIRPEKNLNQNYHCQGCEEEPIFLRFQQSTKAKIILEWKEMKYAKMLVKIKDQEEEKEIQGLQLEQCFLQWTEDNNLDQDCRQCRRKTNFKENSHINKPPIVLIIYFQKFKDTGELIEQFVDFPLNCLNIKECLKSKQDQFYDLYAVINNKTFKNQTHYTAYIKKNEWYEFDDSQVLPVNKVQTPNAYMLFYINKDTPSYSNLNLSDFS